MSADDDRRAGRLADLSLLGAAWLVAVLLVDPRGDFPLNDDWAWIASVERLLRDGSLRPHDWASMTLVSQTLWGGLVALLFGPTPFALRLSTLLLGLLTVAGVYLLGRELRAPRPIAAAAAITLAANPLFLALSHTFMTDVPMLAAMVWALLAFARALRDDWRLAWAAGTALSVAAVLCRQPALVVPLAFLAAVLLWSGAGWRWRTRAALSVGLAVAALVLWEVAMLATGGLPANHGVRNAFLQRLWLSPLPSSLRLLSGTLANALLYGGLFLLPLLVLFETGWRRARISWLRWGGALQIVTVALLALHLLGAGRLMPVTGNMLIRSGIGPITLHDWYIRGLANDPLLPQSLWLAVTVAAVLGAGLLVSQCAAAAGLAWREARRLEGDPTRAMLLAGGALYIGLTCVTLAFDRYYTALLPMLGVALIPPAPRSLPRRAWGAALALLALWGAFAIAATHDYLAWNRARWAALRLLTEVEGVDPRRIDGGLEFNGPRFFVPNASGGGGGRSWWWVVDDEYLITMGPVPGYEMTRRHPYRRWLPPGEAAITVQRRAR